MQRRDQGPMDKDFLPKEDFIRNASDILQDIHNTLLARATEMRDQNITECGNRENFDQHWSQDAPGWLMTPWNGTREQEEELSKKHKISIRCLPLTIQEGEPAPCFLTSEPTRQRALWGRSY